MPAISRNGKFLTKTKTQADIGGVSSVRLYEKQLGSQGASSYTVFTLSGSYVPGSNTLVVHVNGQKAEKVDSATNSTQYEETNSKTITFGSSLQSSDIVEFSIYGSYNVNNHEWNTNTYETTLSETTDEVTLPFTPDEGMISIYIDGVRQQSDAYTLSGTTVTFSEELPIGTKLLFVSPNTDDMPLTNADTVDGYQSTQLMGRRNIIINGDSQIAQRGTTVSVSGFTGMTVDRFKLVNASDGAFTLSQESQTITNNLRNYISLTTTTADTSLSAAQAVGIQYIIEGYDILPIIGKVCTLSFWAKTSYAGIYCIGFTNFKNGTTDRSYVAEITLPADVWVYRTITFTMHDLTSGSYWDTTNLAGLRIWFSFASGSNFITTPNSWQNGNYVATSNQVNLAGAINRTFGLTGVQLEVGPKATDFEYSLVSDTLIRCQRYYEKSYKYSVAPATSTPFGVRTCFCMSTGDISRLFLSNPCYLVAKREEPTTLTLYSEDGTTSNVSLYNNNTSKIAITSVQGKSEKNIGHYLQMSSNATAGLAYVFHFTADSDF